MLSDSWYSIGASHRVCQDYALAARGEGLAYGLLSDGCSGTAHSDVAARVMVHCTNRYLTDADSTLISLPDVVGASATAAELLGLGKASLDATLLGATASLYHARFYIAGDGFAVVRWKEGSYRIWRVEFTCDSEEQFPAYPAMMLQLSGDEIEAAIARHGLTNWRRVVTTWCSYWSPTGPIEIHREDPRVAPWFTSPVSRPESVTVFSDGLGTLEGNEAPGVVDVLLAATDFKVKTQGYLQRRMSRMVKDFTAKGWRFSDDVSAAGVLIP